MKMQYVEKFEYTYRSYNGSTMAKIIEELNKMGQEGWELMNNFKDDVGRMRYVFKRKILETTI